MIGFLCNKGKESIYCLNLYSIMNSSTEYSDISVLVFSIDNIDLKGKKVYGHIISNNCINAQHSDIPDKIINFSIQSRKKGIYTLRKLMELNGVKVCNEVNRFNQWMIMEIIASSSLTKQFLLPYKLCNKYNLVSFNEENYSFIMIPQYGGSLSNIIYGNNFDDNKEEILMNSVPILCKHGKLNWIILDSQKLPHNKTSVPVIRTYMQKKYDGEWKILSKSIFMDGKRLEEKIKNVADSVPLMLMNYINNFIPSIYISYMDFIIGDNDIPYFLHLGGWDKRIVLDERNRKLRKEIFINFLDNSKNH